MVAIFDLGRAVFAYNTLTNAAREGARIAIVNQYTPSIVARAKSQTNIVELDDPSVSVTFWQVGSDGKPDKTKPQCNSLVAVGCLAVVRFEATYRPITPFISNILFGSGVTFTAVVAALGRIQLPTESQLTHGRGRCRGLSEAAMNRPSTTASTPRGHHAAHARVPAIGGPSGVRSSSSPRSRWSRSSAASR